MGKYLKLVGIAVLSILLLPITISLTALGAILFFWGYWFERIKMAFEIIRDDF